MKKENKQDIALKKYNKKLLKQGMVCALACVVIMASAVYCFCNCFNSDKYKDKVLENHKYEQQNKLYQQENSQNLTLLYNEGQITNEDYQLLNTQDYCLDKEQFFKENITAQELKEYNALKQKDLKYINALCGLTGAVIVGVAGGSILIKKSYDQKQRKEEDNEKKL